MKNKHSRKKLTGGVMREAYDEAPLLLEESSGYLYIILAKQDHRRYKRYLHEMVAASFVPNDDMPRKTFVYHKNGNRQDNRAENLEWLAPLPNSGQR